MENDLHIFTGAANKAVKPDSRKGVWLVWDSYDVVETEGDAYIVASDDATIEEYCPLAYVPGLFLEFARLSEEGITREVWIDWVERYGALGINRRDEIEDWQDIGLYGPICQEGGPAESYKAFRSEALRANWLLRLIEAVPDPKGPDLLKIFEEVYGAGSHFPDNLPRMSPKRAESAALDVVRTYVQEEIRDCYPTVLPVDGGFVQGWGFDNLLSAMYLQLMWLLTATTASKVEDNIRWCKRPECTKVVDYQQPKQLATTGMKKNDRSRGYRIRRDKEFCSDRCKGLYHYHYVTKPKREGGTLST